MRIKTLKNKIINPDKKGLVVFDMDGTLTKTKAVMDHEMSKLLAILLHDKKVAIIGGGKYELFKIQFLRSFKCPAPLLKNLFLFPTTATSFYRYKDGWKNVYAHQLSLKERSKIKQTFKDVLEEIEYVQPKKVYGKVIEDRGTQITFSALGQDVVAVLGERKGVALKTKWKEENTDTKMKIANLMARRLPDFRVGAAGYTSVDITRKGIDKAYGIKQIEKYLRVPRAQMLFVGDALLPGGNDHAATKTGVDCVSVGGPEDTKRVIRAILTR
ncbi:MAG: HAD-IIB family hydrolase [Candidatus Liptonbacteria bacterium]